MNQIKDCPPTPDIPAPGIYRNVPEKWYHAWDAISNSRMTAFKKSPLHFFKNLSVEETQPMKFGTLCHAGRLEPLSIANKYIVMPRFEDQVRQGDGSSYKRPKATAAYEELVNAFKVANPNKIVVTQDEYDAMTEVVASLLKHEYARKALTGEAEVSLIWVDPETQQLCKGRVDCLNWESKRIGDLKTTADVSEYEWILYKRRYHRQMAFYCDGLSILTETAWQCADIVAAETKGLYGVRAAPVGDDLFKEGAKEFREILNGIKRCRDSGEWPCYESPKTWDKPESARTKDTLTVDENGEVTSW